jgi:hypothetical protein
MGGQFLETRFWGRHSVILLVSGSGADCELIVEAMEQAQRGKATWILLS